MLDNIKSKLLLKIIFVNIRKKKMLKLLKLNKSLLSKLNITIKDFQEYKQLNELNKKYGVNIKDIDVEKICLTKMDLNNEFLEKLCKIDFEELKELDLSNNYNITDIKILENAKFDKLEILKFRSNNISDINVLEKVNFKKLIILDLSSNNLQINLKI